MAKLLTIAGMLGMLLVTVALYEEEHPGVNVAIDCEAMPAADPTYCD